MQTAIEALPTPANRLGESPLWHPDEQALYWCDIPGHRLHRFDPASGLHREWAWHTDVATCAPRRQGGLLLAGRDGLWHWDPHTDTRQQVAAAPYDPAHERFNDGKADSQGHFWCGTIYEPRDQAAAALYRWADGRLERVAGDVTVSNGLAWGLDGRRMYWADTWAHVVYTCDYDPATRHLGERRVWAPFAHRQPGQDLSAYGGRPDGATVDAEGCYWVAMFEGAQVLRLSPQGELLQRIELPVRCPTMPCLGGPDLRTLYITTARDKRPEDELAAMPLSGHVLQVRVDVPGLPTPFVNSP